MDATKEEHLEAWRSAMESERDIKQRTRLADLEIELEHMTRSRNAWRDVAMMEMRNARQPKDEGSEENA